MRGGEPFWWLPCPRGIGITPDWEESAARWSLTRLQGSDEEIGAAQALTTYLLASKRGEEKSKKREPAVADLYKQALVSCTLRGLYTRDAHWMTDDWRQSFLRSMDPNARGINEQDPFRFSLCSHSKTNRRLQRENEETCLGPEKPARVHGRSIQSARWVAL